MSDAPAPKKSWLERMQRSYRLVIMNHETFEEVGSYRLSLFNVYIFLSTLMVLVAFLVVAMIVFTPLKRYIPGYGSANAQPELIRLNQQVDSLKELVDAQELYVSSFRKMIMGEGETLKEVPERQNTLGDSALHIERIEEDELLRQEVRMEDLKAIGQSEPQFAAGQSYDVPLEQLYFTPPITGEVSAPFMPEKKHLGIDILAPKNTPIKAIMDGRVIAADWTLETGHTIGIQHEHNLISFYKHNSALLKETGAFVKAGEAIAIIGNSGALSDGPHLHFELWHKGNPINPAQYFSFN